MPHAKTAHTPANPHGAEVRGDGTIRFRLWAPAAANIGLEIAGNPGVLPMTATDGGWHELTFDGNHAALQYRFVLPDGKRVPDPASRYQPFDVHGPSEIVDPATWSWSDTGWNSRPWEEAVIYEMHVGSFTPEGTFRSAIEKFDHLARLGVTAIELMPVGDFPGRRNWGYDGVLPYAPDSSYGRPEDLKALVEGAHERGLMVFLDVIYNHFGPEGNYLPLYAPQFFDASKKTPWGPAVNFDRSGSAVVRDFFIHNAIYWVRQFHFDGLRFDAVHAIRDRSGQHFLQELARRVRGALGDRRVHLILENEENEASRLSAALYTAQWNDDLHHVLHTAVTGEDDGYYGEYRGDTTKLGRALAEGFAFQGERMEYRRRTRGEPSRHLPPTAFVAFLQNHDQVGNRALGDRISENAPQDAVRAAAAVYLLLPQVPMLFMGEEWNAPQRFPFFCDFDPELADAVRTGRYEEFSRFPRFQTPEQRAKIPDPQAEGTFESSKLRWNEIEEPAHSQWLHWYRGILAVRREKIVPLLHEMNGGGSFDVAGDGAVLVRWHLQSGRTLVLAANLSAVAVSGFARQRGSILWQEGRNGDHGCTLGPWSVLWLLDGSEDGNRQAAECGVEVDAAGDRGHRTTGEDVA